MSTVIDNLIATTAQPSRGAPSGLQRLARRRAWLPGLVAFLCLGGTAGVAIFVHDVTPIATWMIWKLALLWFWALLFGAGCLGFGAGIGRWALRGHAEIPSLERGALAFAIGAAAFGTSMYLAGALRLFYPAVAVILPVVGIGVGLGRWPGARPFRRRARFIRLSCRLSCRLSGSLSGSLAFGRLELAVTFLGALSIGLIYLHVLSPDAPSYDASWTHLVIGQDFARARRLVSAPEWAKAFPHLASLFYTWVFLVPGLNHSFRILLAMHVEFLFVIGTLIGVAALARWLTDDSDARCRAAWVTFFLFPGIFVYDSNLGGSADHIAAVFVAPLFLALVRGSERFSPRLLALGGALVGSALITKYQTAYVTAPLLLLIALRVGRRALVALRTVVLAAMVTSMPYFLENIAFHHNPVYPFKQNLFRSSTPTIPHAAFLVSTILTPPELRGAQLGLGRRLLDALEAPFTFSFHPHYSFLGPRPYFGFLFTLLSPLVFLLPRARRLRVGALVAGGSLFLWGMTYLVDRNLQIILPLMAAVTAAVISKIWRLGWVARIGVVPLLLLQIAWGGDLIFQDELHGAIDHIRAGMDGEVFGGEIAVRREIAKLVPIGGKVLLHGEHLTLGLNREVVSDEMGYQGLIDYRGLNTARQAFDRFRALGITHILWMDQNEPGNHLQRAIVFNALVRPLPASSHGRYTLVALPDALPGVPPPSTAPYRVLVLGMREHPDGIYRIDVLGRCEMRPPKRCQPPQPDTPLFGPANAGTLDAGVDAVVAAPEYPLEPTIASALTDRFLTTWPAGPYHLYVRR